MKLARLLFAILAIAAVSVSCAGEAPTDPDGGEDCPIQGGPWC